MNDFIKKVSLFYLLSTSNTPVPFLSTGSIFCFMHFLLQLIYRATFAAAASLRNWELGGAVGGDCGGRASKTRK